MSYTGGFLVYYEQPSGVEFSVPIKYIVRVSFDSSNNFTTLYFIDGTSKGFETGSDGFYQHTKKIIQAYNERHS